MSSDIAEELFLVNGSRGTVISVDGDDPFVEFPHAKSKTTVRIEKASFTAYDTRLGKVIAERVQFSLFMPSLFTSHRVKHFHDL